MDSITQPQRSAYESFLGTKSVIPRPVGVSVDPDDIHASLFPFQRSITQWALLKGRSAIFADTGLGKTRMQLEWARLIGQPTLILAPLAVARQTVAEASRLGIDVTYARSQDQSGRITVTNYEMVGHFDPAAFGAVVLDESSILKSFEGKIRGNLIRLFADTPYRLCCTATPAPNDISEIANHADFLGLSTRVEMLATFFVHDDDGWRLKGHARDAFWMWMASWSMSIRKPSDLGFADEGYALPPLTIRPVILPTNYIPAGQLFATSVKGVGDRAAVRRSTLADRVRATAAIVAADPDHQWLLWCGLNDESAALTTAIPGAVEVKGADDPESKADALTAFADGHVRVLVSKPSIAGFGMNFQRCDRMAFVGLSDSYEQYYQAIRRSWRFGQRQEVIAYIVLTEPEESIYENVLKKEREATTMSEELVSRIARYEKAEIGKIGVHMNYAPTTEMIVPSWLSTEAS